MLKFCTRFILNNVYKWVYASFFLFCEQFLSFINSRICLFGLINLCENPQFHVTPFQNKNSFFESVYSFKESLLRAINDASRFFLTWSLVAAAIKTLYVNACARLLFKSLYGSYILLMFECPSHRISIFRLASSV